MTIICYNGLHVKIIIICHANISNWIDVWFTGDCVYIMQGDMVKAAQEAGKVPYTYVKRLVPDELLIFRVEKLWKDER